MDHEIALVHLSGIASVQHKQLSQQMLLDADATPTAAARFYQQGHFVHYLFAVNFSRNQQNTSLTLNLRQCHIISFE